MMNQGGARQNQRASPGGIKKPIGLKCRAPLRGIDVTCSARSEETLLHDKDSSHDERPAAGWSAPEKPLGHTAGHCRTLQALWLQRDPWERALDPRARPDPEEGPTTKEQHQFTAEVSALQPAKSSASHLHKPRPGCKESNDESGRSTPKSTGKSGGDKKTNWSKMPCPPAGDRRDMQRQK